MTIEAIGWILAAFSIALWWGERGRRLDMAMTVGLPVGRKKKPKTPTKVDPPVQPLFDSEEKKMAIEMIMKESGVDEAAARAELDALVGGAYGGRVVS